MEKTNNRIVFLDWLRVAACLMVMTVHSVEPFYLGGPEGTFVASAAAGFWADAVYSLLRCCVPLFVITSSYLLFPVKTDSRTFYRRRFSRVAIPLVVWVLLYAFVPQGPGHDFAGNGLHALLNFPDPAGHLWFVYMLLGIYLVMPIFSPWIEKVSKKGEQAFLLLWLFTTAIPYFRRIALHLYGTEFVWGSAPWNEFGLFYGVSGFIGYVVMGHYFKKHIPELSWKKTLSIALPLILVGFAANFAWFGSMLPKEYPLSAPYQYAVDMEVGWTFCGTGVALVTAGMFLLFRKITASGAFYRRIVLPLSGLSFGMYLMHIFILNRVFPLMQGLLGPMNPWVGTPLIVLSSALATFCLSACATWILSKVPGHKYVIG